MGQQRRPWEALVVSKKLTWDQIVDACKALDRCQDYQELAQQLRQLPAQIPQAYRAIVAYWRGKLALLEGDDSQAVQFLSEATALAPQNAATHVLLGSALVRCQQWMDARTAFVHALELQPALAVARLELAAVELELADPAGAFALVASLPDNEAGALRGQHARASVQATSDLSAAAKAVEQALLRNSRLPEAVLLEWVQFTGGLLLLGSLQVGRTWLMALCTITPAAAAIANPVPRRVALIALSMLELIQPSKQSVDDWLEELAAMQWLPPSASEHRIWDAWLESWVLTVAGRLEGQTREDRLSCDRPLEICIQALQCIQPPGRNNYDLFLRLTRLRQGLQLDSVQGADHLGGALERHGRDLLVLMKLLERCCELDDQRLRRCRRQLELQLQGLSDALLTHPQQLVIHPSKESLQLALQWRHGGFQLLKRCRERIVASSDAVPCHQRPLRHWLLLASQDLPQCFLYRVDQKRQQLEALGCSVRIVLRDDLDQWLWSEALVWADAVIVCRLPATASVLRAIDAVHQAGLPSWYDVDDLVVDPDNGVPALDTYGGTITPHQHRCLQLDVGLFAAAMRACHGVIVSTPTLARRWQELEPGQPVHVLANLAPAELRTAKRRPSRFGSRPRLVVASGTKAHKQVWINELAPALAQLLERHPNLRLSLLGHLQLPLVLQAYTERVQCHPFSDYATYLTNVGKADIGLVALEPGLYTDAKSAIRWMEFSYLGLASVLSPSRTYTEILEDGVHTRFARGIDAWVAVVEQLLANPGETRAIARRAQQRAQQLFGPQQGDAFWRSLLKESSAPLSKTPSRRRLLVVNVYFAPQSVGGATRIAQDQVRALCENLGDAWDVTVLCSDPEPWMAVEPPDLDADDEREVWEIEQPLPVEVHRWHGARVVRLTLPQRNWKQHHDLSVEAFCRGWFRWERFDLIHCHCVQVLGVGPLIAAREQGIPYAITLHDGWWLSPRQFLVTLNGSEVDVTDPLSHLEGAAAADPSERVLAVERRRCLESVLAGAAARWAVSDFFAALHQKAGVDGVHVMENRWQPMTPIKHFQRPRPSDQPLRCCFIGGMALHKGWAVLQASILNARPVEPGLQLTVIDSTLKPNQSRRTTCGEIPVLFVPSVPMDRMATFYADQDVLLAPSIWPESYGLVTREALSAGLWVVASDVGALAEPIRHGENGHCFRSGDSSALTQILEELSRAHPQPQPLIAFQDEHLPLHIELSNSYAKLTKTPAK